MIYLREFQDMWYLDEATDGVPQDWGILFSRETGNPIRESTLLSDTRRIAEVFIYKVRKQGV